jgi:hypothetical protein
MTNPLDSLTKTEQHAITRAAMLSHAGLEAEAEATRFAADYHSIHTRTDADGNVQAKA